MPNKFNDGPEFGGKTVVVTGGTSGIGHAVAVAFAEAGANVVAAGLEGSLAGGEGLPRTVRSVVLDVTDTAAVQALLDSVSELHVLVNAAGMIAREEEFELDTFERVINVNLTGTMRACLAARPKLRISGGSIVNLASMYSFFGSPRAPAYTASKGAVAQLTRSLAVAWAAEGIRVNAVAPGWIATPFTQPLRDDSARSAPILARTPFGRWGRAEEIAGPVLFLASSAASFITGAIVPVDGGYSAA